MTIDQSDWIERDYTGELLGHLRQGEYASLPAWDGNEARSKTVLTLLWEAGFELRTQRCFYNRFVPVWVIAPMPRTDASSLPGAYRAPLAAQQQAKAERVRNSAQGPQDAAEMRQAFTQGAMRLSWEAAKLIAGRIQMFWDWIGPHVDPAEMLEMRTFAFGMTSTVLSVAELSLDAAGVDSPAVKALMSCASFVVSVAGMSAGSLAAPLGLGVIGLIATAESFANCSDSLSHLRQAVNAPMKQLSTDRQLGEILGPEKNSCRYERSGDRIDYFDRGNNRNDSVHTTDPRADRVTARDSATGRVRCELGREYERDRGGGREVCREFRCREERGDGSWREVRGEVCGRDGGEISRDLF